MQSTTAEPEAKQDNTLQDNTLKEKDYILNNPGLQSYDLTQYSSVKGINFFESDATIVRLVERHIPEQDRSAVLEHLSQFGQVSSEKLNELIFEAHKEGKYPVLDKYDHVGNRIDEIRYCDEQEQARKIAYDYGIVNLDYHKEWQKPFHYIHRMVLAYLQNQNGEGGVACPLAMTEGLINILKELGTPEQQERYLPIVTDPDRGSHFMAGQYITERVGGSNVSANRTVAVPQGDGKYLLYGEKWFCSNPGEVWVTTARLEDTNMIGLFVVPRYKDDGELNEHHILRTKDIIGSRGKATAEIEYSGVEADVLGKPSRGLAYLLQYVLKISRIHVALGGLGMGRRAYLEAFVYAKIREAYGKKIKDIPLVMKNLLAMKTAQVAAELAVFDSWLKVEEKNPVEDVMVSLLKYKVSTLGSWMAREAILTLGGNGIIGDFSVLPRLMNDNIINETWEGTHNVLGEHTVKAFRRPANQRKFWDELDRLTEAARKWNQLAHEFEFFDRQKEILQNKAGEINSWSKEAYQINILPLVDQIYRTYAMALLLHESAIDLDKGSDIFPLFARAYREMEERHITGFVEDGGLYTDPDKIMELLEY